MTLARFLRISRQRLKAIARPTAVDDDLHRELAFHLDELTHEKLAGGLSTSDARREARREFGAVALIAERSRDARGITAIDGCLDDARHGLRLLRRTPAFTTVAGLALAIGIGATAAAAVVMAVVLAGPLPFTDDGRLVTVRTSATDSAVFARGISIHQYRAWQAHSATLAAIGASRGGAHVIADASGAPETRVQGQAFTPSLWSLLGVRPAAGRLFEEVSDPFDRRALVAVISHRLWQQRYGGAPGVIGRRIRVDRAAREIVGIMPADFRLQNDNVDLWIPLVFAGGPHAPAQDAPLLLVTARLRHGATISAASAELETIAQGLHPDRVGPELNIESLRDTLYGWTKPRLSTLAAVAALLLTLACANVAALLLARGALRRREIALRLALGAPRRRIVRQLLTESLMLGFAAAVPAACVASLGVRAVSAALGPPPGLPRLSVAAVDGWVLCAVAALCLLSSLAFGVLPAAAASRVDLNESLSPGNGGTAVIGRSPWRATLVAVQVGLAEVLMIGAALLTLSYVRLSGRELNFEPRGLLTFGYTLPAAEFLRPLDTEGTPAFDVSPGAARTMQTLYERLKQLPGAGEVGGISFPPVNSLVLPTVGVRRIDDNGVAVGEPRTAAHFIVTPNLFAALRTPVVRGREFEADDISDAPWALVINEAMARLAWPGENPLGRRIRLDVGDSERPRVIIGVVRNIPTRLEWPAEQPVVYTSYLQQPQRYSGRAAGMLVGMTFVMRTGADHDAVFAAARQAAAEITPGRPLDERGTVQSHLYAQLAERRNYVTALAWFALLAAFLAMAGLHGVMTYAVVTRANEIAVRKALGAQTRQILAMVAIPSATIVAGGLAIGAAGALAGFPLLAPQLWRVAPSDPLIVVGVPLALCCAAALACLAAMRRAAAVDPSSRLRAE